MESGIEKGRPLPAWVEQCPDVEAGDEFYMKAFYELTTCRQQGWSMGPIPWSAAVQYAEWSGLDRDVALGFFVVIRELDREYLKHVAAEDKRAKAARDGETTGYGRG